ncbi:TetR/AcrR family transcriptional regulator [Frondihabitans sp. PAMC 28766]|uniref:TetR/AcrR family transcriptional regulator n=1 Tax=Frondihabitans sp. PAMC 28766 TaxID=1795630 RepID=UPI001EF4D74F|nr:TetR/AcrR family transcriptional regulator [Frondihabitans sp. PAMC 28766]
MPDIAAEAGLSTGAAYRYFASKEEMILEIAGDAFRMIFEPVIALLDRAESVGVAELVAASIAPVNDSANIDAAGNQVSSDELLRCAVQAWAELLRHDSLRETANQGFESVRARMADALRRGQAKGTVPVDLDPDRSTRVVMALLHGFILQRVAFGLTDIDGFSEDVRSILTSTSVLR